jgi:PAS domain-containing protein
LLFANIPVVTELGGGWMSYQYTPYIWPLVVTTVVCSAVAVTAWRRRRVVGAVSLLVIMLAIIEWSVGYIFELSSVNLATVKFWANLGYIGIAIVPVGWFAFALQYTGQGGKLTSRRLILLLVVPVLTQVLLQTDSVHGLMRRHMVFDVTGPVPLLNAPNGPFFWVFVAYCYGLLLVGFVALVQLFLNRPSWLRAQAGAMLLGGTLPLIWNLLHTFAPGPRPSLDLTPSVFAVSGLVFALSLFRFRMLDLVPVAREAVFEGMADAVVVLDAQQRIVDMNHAARRVFGIPMGSAVGVPAERALASVRGVAEFAADEVARQATVSTGEGELKRTYHLQLSPLMGRGNRPMGRNLVLRDISDLQRTREEREIVILELRGALAQVKRLSGLLPICASCKKIRDDAGYWREVEEYLRERSDADFSHGICPDCARRLYPELYESRP